MSPQEIAAAARAKSLLAEEAGGVLRVRATNEVRGLPNRARMVVWLPTPNRLAVCFYKESRVPFSTDRFAYGYTLQPPDGATAEKVGAWLDFVAKGFPPDGRPEDLREAIPFEVP